jgi:Cu(I)-responsive transcriptional regulator
MLAFLLLAKRATPISKALRAGKCRTAAFPQQASQDCEAKSMGRLQGRLGNEESAMNVGDAAERSGLPAKTIRYYEEIGLLRPARAGNGYRDYSGEDIHRLAFLRRARNLGFSIDDCRQLMALYQDRDRASHDVREIAAAHVRAIEEKVRELQSMRSTLQKLIHACHGDDRPDCPILDDMAGAA